MTSQEFNYILIIGLVLVIMFSMILPYNSSKCSIDQFDDSSSTSATTDLPSCLTSLQNINGTLTTCLTNQKQLQVQIASTQTDVANNKMLMAQCSSDKQALQNQFDTMNQNYTMLQMKLDQVNQTSLNGTSQVSTSQENISNCQAQMQNMSTGFVTFQENYNGLVQQYGDLSNRYNDLNDEYRIKCYKYNKRIT